MTDERAIIKLGLKTGAGSSSSYELQHALHMRSIMHCFVWRGVRGKSPFITL